MNPPFYTPLHWWDKWCSGLQPILNLVLSKIKLIFGLPKVFNIMAFKSAKAAVQGWTNCFLYCFPPSFVKLFTEVTCSDPNLSEIVLIMFSILDPAKRMNGVYGYIGYFGVIILSIYVALQLLGIF